MIELCSYDAANATCTVRSFYLTAGDSVVAVEQGLGTRD